MVTQDFILAKLAILSWKFVIFAKDENTEFFKPCTANLSYDQKCSPFGDLTNIAYDFKLLSLVQRLRYVQLSQATPISYTFLVADYWSTTATLSYKSLWQFGEVHT